MFKRSILVLVVICAVSVFATPAFAEGGGCPAGSAYTTCAPGWEITSHSNPTDLPPGGKGLITLDVFNVGAVSTEAGHQITVTDGLPAGVTALYAGSDSREEEEDAGKVEPVWDCTGTGTSVVRCVNDPVNLPTFPGGGVPIGLGAADRLTPPVAIEVAVAASAPHTAENRASVAGGGAAESAATSSPLHIGEPAGFGVANWDAFFSGADGTLDTQAGSHPYSATFDLEVNTQPSSHGTGKDLGPLDFSAAGGELRDATVDLPPGFVGNPTAAPQCPRAEFESYGLSTSATSCLASTIIGFSTTLAAPQVTPVPIYNLVPPRGVAAQFGFSSFAHYVFLDSGVRTGGDSGIVTRTNDIPQGRNVLGAVVTLWGVPGDPSHDPIRCSFEFFLTACPSGAGTAPLLTLPTACGEPQPFTVQISDWGSPAATGEKTVFTHDSNGPASEANGPTSPAANT
jgi:hypothetical protein